MNDIIIKNSKVVINTPTKVPPKEKHFKKMWKIGGWRLYLTHNFRLKNSQKRDQHRNHSGIVQVKEMLWKKHNGCCECCGMTIDKFCHSQVHHILSWWRFPQFETDERNLMLLCCDCHHHIHKSAFLDLKMQIQKAKELGINLYDYYNKEDVDFFKKILV